MTWSGESVEKKERVKYWEVHHSGPPTSQGKNSERKGTGRNIAWFPGFSLSLSVRTRYELIILSPFRMRKQQKKQQQKFFLCVKLFFLHCSAIFNFPFSFVFFSSTDARCFVPEHTHCVFMRWRWFFMENFKRATFSLPFFMELAFAFGGGVWKFFPCDNRSLKRKSIINITLKWRASSISALLCRWNESQKFFAVGDVQKRRNEVWVEKRKNSFCSRQQDFT